MPVFHLIGRITRLITHAILSNVLRPKSNCGVGLVNCFFRVSLMYQPCCLLPCCQGKLGELTKKNSLPNLLHSSFWDVVQSTLHSSHSYGKSNTIYARFSLVLSYHTKSVQPFRYYELLHPLFLPPEGEK